MPDVAPAFAAINQPADTADASALTRLERRLDAELDDAATTAFVRSFLVGALLAALAAVPLLLRRQQHA